MRHALIWSFTAILLCSTAFAQDQPTAKQSDRSAEAGQFVDGLLARLHQSFDFRTLPADAFAANWLVSYRSFPADFPIQAGPKLLAELPDEQVRAKALADWNFFYTTLVYLFMRSNPKDIDTDNLGAQLPPEVVQQMSRNTYCVLDGPNLKLTRAEQVRDYVAEATQLTAMLRQGISPSWFQSSGYKDMDAHARQQLAVELKHLPQGAAYKQGYIVLRDGFVFILVEENGRLRLLNVQPATM